MPWGETARTIAVGWAVVMAVGVLGLIAAVLFYGLSYSDFELSLGICAVLALVGTLFAGLSKRRRTRQSVLADIHKRQKRRNGEPRDLAALGAADTEARRAWHHLVRRRARRSAAARLLVALPLIALTLAETWKQAYEIAHPIGFAFACIAVPGLVVYTAWAVRRQIGDPRLLVGDFESSEHTLGTEAAKTVVLYGRTRTVTLLVRASFVLRADGTLSSFPDLLGMQTVGARRAVVRRLIEGEHCVLLCSGADDALFQAGALAATSV